MARPPRLDYPDGLWHVTNRGVEQRTIYLDDRDRAGFLRLLQKVLMDHRWQLFAYVLMSNHYHLLFKTPTANLSRGMKDLDGNYASTFNTRYRRVGHLFQGRFKSHPVDSDPYLLEAARYIVLNPVRAGLVKAAGEWNWSSYRATASLTEAPSWLDPSPILEHVGSAIGYREFVAAGVGQKASPWENVTAQEMTRRQTRTFRETTIESIRAAVDATETSASDRRALFAVLARRHTSASCAAIGQQLGITGQGVGYLIRVSEARLKTDRLFAELVDGVRSKVESEYFQLST